MNPITIEDKAATEILDIFKNKNIPDNYKLRVIAEGTGCSGVNYRLGFDEKADDDLEYEISEVPVIMKKKDFMHIIGIKIGFIDTVDTRGFVFKKD